MLKRIYYGLPALIFSLGIFSLHVEAIVVPAPDREETLPPAIMLMMRPNNPTSLISNQLIDKEITINERVLYQGAYGYSFSYVKGISGNNIMMRSLYSDNYNILNSSKLYRASLYMPGLKPGTKVYLPGKNGKKTKGCIFGFRQNAKGEILAGVISKRKTGFAHQIDKFLNGSSGLCGDYLGKLHHINMNHQQQEKVED